MEWIPRAKHPSNPLTSQVGKQPIPDKNGRACLPSAHACSPASHPGVTHNRSSRRSTEEGSSWAESSGDERGGKERILCSRPCGLYVSITGSVS